MPTANEKLVQRIREAQPFISDPFENDKLDYIARQITPVGLRRRSEDDQDVSHLTEEAARIIKRFSVPQEDTTNE